MILPPQCKLIRSQLLVLEIVYQYFFVLTELLLVIIRLIIGWLVLIIPLTRSLLHGLLSVFTLYWDVFASQLVWVFLLLPCGIGVWSSCNISFSSGNARTSNLLANWLWWAGFSKLLIFTKCPANFLVRLSVANWSSSCDCTYGPSMVWLSRSIYGSLGCM